jgi:hypothetical protein
MVGVNPGAANEAVFADTRGAYFWVAAKATSDGEFRQLIEADIAARGMSVDEVSDVMRGEDAMKKRQNAEIDWEVMIRAAEGAAGLYIDKHFYIYLARD